jgi:GNAT superfamily N-acetyltransferase
VSLSSRMIAGRMANAAANIDIIVREEATSDERATIIGGLVAYNEAHSMPARHQELAVIAKDGDEVIGGLFGFTSWNWLFIRQLWIAEASRGSGIGSCLIAAAERAAVERGCANAHCDTFEFQALPFYRKLGYEVFGQLADYPPGFTRYFLQKRDLLRGD